MRKYMPAKIKIITLVFVFLVSNFATYKFTSEKTNFKIFLYDIGFSLNILKMLEDGKYNFVKQFLVNDINRVFYEAERSNDIDSFKPLCKYLSNEGLNILSKYDKAEDKIVRDGKDKIKKMCKEI